MSPKEGVSFPLLGQVGVNARVGDTVVAEIVCRTDCRPFSKLLHPNRPCLKAAIRNQVRLRVCPGASQTNPQPYRGSDGANSTAETVFHRLSFLAAKPGIQVLVPRLKQ